MTAALLGIIVVSSALSTLVPQHRPAAFYEQRYPVAANAVFLLQIDTFFRSPLFLVPSFLFFINLCVCTGDRICRRMKSEKHGSVGPDLIHFGIILLVISGMVSLYGRREGYVRLGVGETADLFGSGLKLLEFRVETYEDGSPKEYRSVMRLDEGGVSREVSVAVNHPLRIGGTKLYQDSYTITRRVILKDMEDGALYYAEPGDRFVTVQGECTLLSVETASGGDAEAVFDGNCKGDGLSPFGVGVDGVMGGYTVLDIQPYAESGLHVVKDPGFVPVLCSLALLMSGIAITYIRKTAALLKAGDSREGD